MAQSEKPATEAGGGNRKSGNYPMDDTVAKAKAAALKKTFGGKVTDATKAGP